MIKIKAKLIEDVANTCRVDAIRHVNRLLYGACIPADSAQDLFQEALIKLWQLPLNGRSAKGKKRARRPFPRTAEGVRRLLFAVIHNLAVNLLKQRDPAKATFEPVTIDGDELPILGAAEPGMNREQEIEHEERTDETRDELEEAMRSLTRRSRAIFKRRSEGASFRKIGKKYGLSEDAARVAYDRAKKDVAAYFANKCRYEPQD